MTENKNAKTPADGPEYERGFIDGMQRQMQLHVNRVIKNEFTKIFGPNLDIIRMAREAGLAYGSDDKPLGSVTRFAALVAAAEREKVVQWMTRQGYATGHGDSTEDLLKELEWQIEERVINEREACASICFQEGPSIDGELIAEAIRARGNT